MSTVRKSTNQHCTSLLAVIVELWPRHELRPSVFSFETNRGSSGFIQDSDFISSTVQLFIQFSCSGAMYFHIDCSASCYSSEVVGFSGAAELHAPQDLLKVGLRRAQTGPLQPCRFMQGSSAMQSLPRKPPDSWKRQHEVYKSFVAAADDGRP